MSMKIVLRVDFCKGLTYNCNGVGGIYMAGHNDPNYVTENPFEGRGRASQRNDAIDAGIGFVVPFGVFTIMFIIAMIVEVATR